MKFPISYILSIHCFLFSAFSRHSQGFGVLSCCGFDLDLITNSGIVTCDY